MALDRGIWKGKVWFAETYSTTTTGGATTGLRPQLDQSPFKFRLYWNTWLVRVFNPSTTETLFLSSFNNELEWTSGLPLDEFYPILPQQTLEIPVGTRIERVGDGSMFAVNTGASSFDYNVIFFQKSTWTRFV
jgi:hypothetical protein